MRKTLDRLIKSQDIPSTILFNGGKLEDALYFAEKLTTGAADIRVYSPEGKSQMYAISSIHELITEVGLPPLQSERRVFILDEIERMLPVHSNALLKTLEEPDSRSILIMLTSNLDAVQGTILSRAVIFPFFPMPDQSEDEFKQEVLPVLIAGISGDFAALTKATTLLDEKVGALPEEERRKRVEKILAHILYWFRDSELLHIDPESSLIHFKEEREHLRKMPRYHLNEIFDAIGKAQLGFDRHLKLRQCLDQLFLRPAYV